MVTYQTLNPKTPILQPDLQPQIKNSSGPFVCVQHSPTPPRSGSSWSLQRPELDPGAPRVIEMLARQSLRFLLRTLGLGKGDKAFSQFSFSIYVGIKRTPGRWLACQYTPKKKQTSARQLTLVRLTGLLISDPPKPFSAYNPKSTENNHLNELNNWSPEQTYGRKMVAKVRYLDTPTSAVSKEKFGRFQGFGASGCVLLVLVGLPAMGIEASRGP